jgi:hypothetical protein
VGQYQCPKKSHCVNNAPYAGFTSVFWSVEYLDSLPRLNVQTQVIKLYANNHLQPIHQHASLAFMYQSQLLFSDTRNKKYGTLALANSKDGYMKHTSNKDEAIILMNKATL